MTKEMEKVATEWFEELTKFNPGAVVFVMDALSRNKNASIGFTRMNAFGIRGEYLYVLWNDCCDRDTDKAIDVMMNNSKDDILDHLAGLSYERFNFKKF